MSRLEGIKKITIHSQLYKSKIIFSTCGIPPLFWMNLLQVWKIERLFLRKTIFEYKYFRIKVIQKELFVSITHDEMLLNKGRHFSEIDCLVQGVVLLFLLLLWRLCKRYVACVSIKDGLKEKYVGFIFLSNLGCPTVICFNYGLDVFQRNASLNILQRILIIL